MVYLQQVTLEAFDEAVGVRVVVDGGLVAGRPAEEHQVEFAVSLVDEVPCVLVLVKLGKLLPVALSRVVGAEQKVAVNCHISCSYQLESNEPLSSNVGFGWRKKTRILQNLLLSKGQPHLLNHSMSNGNGNTNC